jgi:heptosyltransferase-2
VEHNLKLLEGFGLKASDKTLVLNLGHESMNQATQRLIGLGISKEDVVFGLSPGSTNGTLKRWYPDRFARVAARIASTYNARGIIFGAPDEHDLGEFIVHEASVQGIYNLAGKTTLDDAISLIAHCGLFISNDAGLMHVAAALDVPLVAIFGPSDYRTTAPWCTRYILVRKEGVECSPCMRKEDCSYDHQCMKEISVEDVFHASGRLIEQYGLDALGTCVQHRVISETPVPIV